MKRAVVTVREYNDDGELARETITEVSEEPDPEPEPAAPLDWWNPLAWYPAILS